MRILISNSSPDPIYEQIVRQIKGQIISGVLSEGEPLPSIRKLAHELQISVITTKRAYEELEKEGLIDTVGGKGTFVASQNQEFMREKRMKVVETKLADALRDARLMGVSYEELGRDDAAPVGGGIMMENALDLSGVQKTFKGFSLKDVSFQLPKGYVMGLVGPNGAGKTTLIKLIMNLMAPEAGEIKILGLDSRTQEAEAKARIGFVYDVMPFYSDVSLWNTKRAVAPFYEKWDEGLFMELAGTFDLPLKKKVKSLSQGMRTKFALALALSHGAELLILDEPTTGLDPVFRRELLHGLSGLLRTRGNQSSSPPTSLPIWRGSPTT